MVVLQILEHSWFAYLPLQGLCLMRSTASSRPVEQGRHVPPQTQKVILITHLQSLLTEEFGLPKRGEQASNKWHLFACLQNLSIEFAL